MTVEVTQKDIDQSAPGCLKCPVAQSFLRILKPTMNEADADLPERDEDESRPSEWQEFARQQLRALYTAAPFDAPNAYFEALNQAQEALPRGS